IRDTQVTRRIDRALAVLRRNNDQCTLVNPVTLEGRHHGADGSVGEFDLALQGWRGSADGIQIAASEAELLLDELLPNADHLEVHPQEGRPGSFTLAVVR